MKLRARRKALRFAAGLAAGCALFGCGQVQKPQRFEFVFRIESDPGEPLAGASVIMQDQKLGESDAQGLVNLGAVGREGDRVTFAVQCPAGYISPDAAISVQLLRMKEADKRPEYSVTCPPLRRSIVVAVRAAHGAGLPVVHLGKELARLAADGAAHVLLKVTPNEEIQLTLDTSGHSELVPKNPSVRFAAAQRDEIFVFDHEFTVLGGKPKQKRHRPAGPIQL